MFQKNPAIARKEPMMLRCMWVPAHTGPNAPLSAVWIQTPRYMPVGRQTATANAAEGDLQACAA
jgi:hypothetical protein